MAIRKFFVESGQKFGWLEVVKEADGYDRGNGSARGSQHRWIVCECKCGKVLEVPLSRLRSPTLRYPKSCGCARRLVEGEKLSMQPLYSVWKNMIARCHEPMDARYPGYGAKGIRVCDRWRFSITAFMEDMGERPEGFTIERIDRFGDYEPDNCKWASYAEQNRNTSQTRYLEFDGKRMCVTDWAEYLGMNRNTLAVRLWSGWSVERALGTPVEKKSESVCD